MECNIVIIVALLGITMGQDYFEERHKNQVRTEFEHLKEIPARFEIRGLHALSMFKKYVTDIQNLATKNNITITYKVKVDTQNRKYKTRRDKHMNSKKFNVPLKKKNLKLSSFEAELRKHINPNTHMRKMSEDIQATTDKMIIHSTKVISSGKYKPIINGVKSKYSKKVKPVRTKVFTLTE